MPDGPSVAVARREPYVLVGIVVAAVVVTAIRPHDAATWWLEAAPVLIGLPLVVAFRRRFPLTPLLQRLLVVHALILLLGAHYTYARVPLGDWLRGSLDLARNPYDRIGHLAQGFVPAILARELLLRTSPLRRGGWLRFLVTATCLGFSAFYELIEWWTALAAGEAADAFLGTQGDVWDTQWDMALCLLGAIAAQALLWRLHDRHLARLP
jgi:putative membrane protein